MNIKKIVINLILIILLLSITIILYKNSRRIDEEEVNYLRNNYRFITSDSDSLNIIDDDINNSFLVSEIHGIKANYEIKYALLKYLNDKSNIRFFLVEISFSSGYLLNEYIKTGDELLLDKVFAFYKGSTFWTKEEYNFYKRLYELNKSLPEDKKIIMIGIDIEHSLDSSIELIKYLNIDIDNKDILNLKNKEDESIDNILYNFLIKNIDYYKMFYSEVNWQFRENKIYENYLFLKDIYNIDKFYSQFGAMHCLNGVNPENFKSFAYYLDNNDDSNVKDKLVIMMTFYKDSNYIEPQYINNLLYYQHKNISKNYITHNLDVFKEEGISIFKLNTNKSPFSNELIWYNDYDIKTDNVTTDYYQYIIFIKGSKSCTPLEKTNSSLDVIRSFVKGIL